MTMTGLLSCNYTISVAVDSGWVGIDGLSITNNVTKWQIAATPDADDPTETAVVWMYPEECDPNWGPCPQPVSTTVQIVNCPTPTITEIKPSTWFAGKTYDKVVITGTGFTTPAKATANCPVTPVSITTPDGSVVAVSGVTVGSKTKITAIVKPDASTPTETATVKVGTAPNSANSASLATQPQILGNQIICNGPNMQCNGNVISTTDGSQPPTLSAVVGQQIALTTNPNLPITPKTTTWTVDGTKIAGYNPTTGPTDVTPVKAADLKKANITFYWVYPNSVTPVAIPVTYTYCADIPGLSAADVAGKLNCSLPANASFNLSGPGDAQMNTDPYDRLNIDMIIDKPPCFPTSDDKDPFLYYANASGYGSPCPGVVTGDPQGIKFTQPDNSSNGSYSFVQIVTGGRVNYASGKSKGAYITTPGLDREYPYPPLAIGDLYVSDSPDTALVDTTIYSKVSRSFSANMFLLWTSSIPNSIPVPIGSQKWHFKTSTTNSGYPSSQNWTQPVTDYVGKDGDPVNYVQTAPSQTSYGYPTWKGVATPVWSTTNANEVEQEDEQ